MHGLPRDRITRIPLRESMIGGRELFIELRGQPWQEVGQGRHGTDHKPRTRLQ
ncbi:hypothetical protein [Metallococcus carri]|uniref:hypothetical protein n=1 Tax=Metallococcus carri TaxID=1656884 RepID=UPI001F276024|nr:hypothetical protein [Metallococcus carri]